MYTLAELQPIYDSRKSFYKKALILDYGDVIKLQSYNTIVVEIRGGNVKINGLYSATTTRHIIEFLRQNGQKAGSKTDLIEMYL